VVDVGGHQVRRYDAGSGDTTIVLVHGAEDCVHSWLPVFRRVAEFARVIAYDRPGLGGSPAGLVLVDATPDAIAQEAGVKAGFAASGIAASILKASAPLGILRLLIRSGAMPLYPEQRRFRRLISDEEYREWIDAVVSSFSRGAGAELRPVLPAAHVAHEQEAALERPQFGDLPLAVLTSHAYGDTWIAMQSELPKRSRHSIHRVTDDRSHDIHMKHPDLVIEAVKTVHGQVRSR